MKSTKFPGPDINTRWGHDDWRSSAYSLRSIEVTLRMRKSSFGPLFGRAISMSGIAMGLLLLLNFVARLFEIDLRGAPGVPDWIGPNELIACCTVTVFLFFYSRDDIPRTWSQKLDKELAEHKPLDIEAYKELQSTTSANNFIADEAVLDWIAAEQNAIADLRAQEFPLKSEFLDREL